MHVVPESMKRPTKERLPSEKFFKWYNKGVTAIQLACFLYAISALTGSAGKTFETDMWGFRALKLNLVLATKTANCTLNTTINIGAYRHIPYQNSAKNLVYDLAQLAYVSKVLVVMMAATVFISAINRLLFDLNVHKFQQYDFILRKDLLTLVDIAAHIITLVQAADADGKSSSLRDYFTHCEITSENSLPYVSPYAEVYFAMSLGLFSHVAAMTLLIYNGHRKDLPLRVIPVPDLKALRAASAELEGMELHAAGDSAEDRAPTSQEPAAHSAVAGSREVLIQQRTPRRRRSHHHSSDHPYDNGPVHSQQEPLGGSSAYPVRTQTETNRGAVSGRGNAPEL
jgi:hypothetical protein